MASVIDIRTNNLEELFELNAKDAITVYVIAPFIKLSTIEWLFELISPNAKIFVLTRARVMDFVLGVSDLEAWKLIWTREGVINIQQSLHAKYYRFDDRVILGSANLTESAIGRTIYPNQELLMVSSYTDDFKYIENELFQDATLADQALYDRLNEKVNKLKVDPIVNEFERKSSRCLSENDQQIVKFKLPTGWCFRSKNPQLLWRYFNSPSSLDLEQKQAAEHDLCLLKIPTTSYDEGQLRELVAHRLMKWDLLAKLNNLFDDYATDDRPFLRYGLIQKELGLIPDSHYGGTDGTTNAFIDWVEYFFPRIYQNVAPEDYSRLLNRTVCV